MGRVRVPVARSWPGTAAGSYRCSGEGCACKLADEPDLTFTGAAAQKSHPVGSQHVPLLRTACPLLPLRVQCQLTPRSPDCVLILPAVALSA